MEVRKTVREYLAGAETTRPQELAFGILREPAAPGYGHQVIVGRIVTLLDRHVHRIGAGRVVISPIDVVLDRQRALVVQPEVVFVSRERLGICDRRPLGRSRPCGRSAVVHEATSRPHGEGQVVQGLRGVRECWLVDPVSRAVDVRDLAAGEGASRVFAHGQVLRSTVLPRLRLRVESVFTY